MSAAAIDLSRLSRREKLDALALLEERERRQAQRLFYHLFPDDDTIWNGPSLMGGLVEPGQIIHARHKYPKHLEFFRESATHREICFMAANRCLTAATVIDTPDGPRQVADLYDRGQPFRVWAWDGSQQVVTLADAPFKKPGRPDCYRVTMSDGSWFECSGAHRILTENGSYRSVASLLASGAIRLQSSSAHAPSAHGEDGQRSSRTLPGSPGRCFPGSRLDDGRLHGVQGIDRESSPSRAGVPARSQLSCISDALVRRCTSILSAALGHPSSLYAGGLTVGQCAAFPGHTGGTISGPDRGSPRSAWLSRAGSMFRLLLVDATPHEEEVQSGQPYAPPKVMNANRIVACNSIGAHEVYDFTVPGLHNYITAGIVHHNTGKTFSGGGFAMSCHLTGLYPDWWEGRRFDHPISAWAAGDTYETTRDIIQLTLLGEIAYDGPRKIMDGRGVIPGHTIGVPTWRSGVQNLVDTIAIKHVSGGRSLLGLKSYDQGRKAFQGTGRHVILFDEEPPMDVYGEALIRTATLDGLIMLTFTPLSGLSEVVLSFMPADQRPDLSN